MCGICGFISRKCITIDRLKKMNDTMYHRGPNDSGEEIFQVGNGYYLGFAQRRLSIMDLSMLGHQPMYSNDKRIVITYNGEIYNFQDIKNELGDYPFKSQCDTEVILAAYLKWGLSCIDRFRGMFAIALYDREKEELYLIRDRVGKKPLYYWLDQDNIVFASELKPIMEYPGFPRVIRKDVIGRYLYQQYICEPDTIFENVYKVEPGQVICFHVEEEEVSERVTSWKYWDIAQVHQAKAADKVNSYEQAKEELTAILKDAVAKRMIADVPLGTFLSGGYDSSLVTALAQSLSNEPVKTYSIGFHEENYNEARYAKEVAKHLGTNHTELYVDEKAMFHMLDDIAKYYDEPFADSSQIPSMLVSQLASKDVTVVLSGDGGDEFFCGYNVYDYVAKAQKLDVLGRVVNGVCSVPALKKADFISKLPFQVQVIARNDNPQTKTQLGNVRYMELISRMVAEQGIPYQYEIENKYHEKNWQERRMLVDEDTYLVGDILCKVDRASMKYSLETRCPLLDVNVVEYSYRLPHEFKYYNGVKKRILKDIAYEYIPRELLDRPKVGFSVPLDQWMRGPLKEQLLDVSESSFLCNQGIFDSKYVNQFVQKYLTSGDGKSGSGTRYSRIVWAFLMFQQWYKAYM